MIQKILIISRDDSPTSLIEEWYLIFWLAGWKKSGPLLIVNIPYFHDGETFRHQGAR